jgi:predicted amidohydrolase
VNHVYSIFANCSLLVGAETDEIGCGHSTIFNEYGRVIGSTSVSGETIVGADIPIGLYRKRHSIPTIRKELYAPCYEKYPARYPPNLFAKELPGTLPEAINYVRRNANW